MAINLLGGSQAVAHPAPMGVTAKNPASSMPGPSTTLPSTQQNPVVTPPPVAPPAATPSPNTYSGLLGQAVGTAMQGSPQANTYAANAAQYGANSAELANKVQGIGDYYQKQVQGLLPSYGQAMGEATTGTQPVGEGNSLNTYNAISNRLGNLQNAEQAALTPYNQALTGQQQAASASQAASGVPLSQYGTQVGALQTAYGSAKPQLGAIGQVPYSPIDLSQGSPLGAPGGTAADAARVAGQFQGAQAAAAAPGQAQATNIQTSGTAGVGTAAAGYATAVQNYNQMSALNSTADLQSKQVQNVLQQTGLNNVSSTDYNTAINKLSGRLGSANVTALNTSLQELRTAYSNLLSSAGMTPTGSEAQSLDVLNSGSTPAQITQAIYQLQTAAYNRLVPQYQQMQQYQQAAGIGGGSTGNTGGGGTVQAGGYSFVQDASGKWVPAQ